MNPPDLTPADTIEKRRKQIERAKAAHLSRQLQTRLQYARLKVDHGWQKQTLNEVENLYFHHYRARISPRGSHNPEKSSANSPKQSSPVHAVAPSSASVISTPVVTTRPSDQQQIMQPTSASQVLTAVATAGEDPAMEVDPPPDQDVPNQPLAIAQSLSPTKPSLQSSPVLRTRTPSNLAPTIQSRTPAPPVAVTPPPSRNIPLTRKPPPPPADSSSLRSRGPSHHATRPSHSAPSSLPGSSNAALTYDSFWSSHSTSTNYRSSLTSTASYPDLSKGDAKLALTTLGTGCAFSMGSPNASFQSLPLQKQPTLARKTSVSAPLRQSFSGSTGSG